MDEWMRVARSSVQQHIFAPPQTSGEWEAGLEGVPLERKQLARGDRIERQASQLRGTSENRISARSEILRGWLEQLIRHDTLAPVYRSRQYPEPATECFRRK